MMNKEKDKVTRPSNLVTALRQEGVAVEPGQNWADLSFERRQQELRKFENKWRIKLNSRNEDLTLNRG